MAALGFLRGGGNPRREAPTFFSKQLKTRMHSSMYAYRPHVTIRVGVSPTDDHPLPMGRQTLRKHYLRKPRLRAGKH